MLETDDRHTNQPPTPRRPSPGRWLLVAAVIAVVAVGGALFVAAAGDDDETQVPATTPTTEPARDMAAMGFEAPLEPGRYFIDPDADPSTSLVVIYEVAAEGWTSWTGAYKQIGGAQTAINIITIDNLVTDGCRGHFPADPAVGPGVDDLANALAALQPFEVTAPPTDVTLFGYQGKHLQLTLPETSSEGVDLDEGCTDGHLESWLSPYGEFTGYNHAEAGRTQDFWILDVDGQRLVIETNEGPTSSAQDLAERDAIFDSISIEP